MPRIVTSSPVGVLEIRERSDAIVSLDWGKRGSGEPCEETPLLREARRQLEAYFLGALRAFDLPLEPGGSTFRAKAWRALQGIPYGETRSYGELARGLGSAPRAVGGACAGNPIAIVIPCHRVVGSSGRLGGYSGRGGLTTKRKLLALERGHKILL